MKGTRDAEDYDMIPFTLKKKFLPGKWEICKKRQGDL